MSRAYGAHQCSLRTSHLLGDGRVLKDDVGWQRITTRVELLQGIIGGLYYQKTLGMKLTFSIADLTLIAMRELTPQLNRSAVRSSGPALLPVRAIVLISDMTSFSISGSARLGASVPSLDPSS
jgi:hypothetical protein